MDKANRETIRAALRAWCEPGAVYELRALNTNRGTVSGYFDDLDALGEAARDVSGHAEGVYLTLNPVDPELLARSSNRAKPYARHTTSDTDILRRRWLPLDFDPVRPSGISATDEERERAFARREECAAWLGERGWPDPLRIDSGNGGHLLYRIDLPNDAASTALIQTVFQVIALRYGDGQVAFDEKTFNAARIWKLPGTLAAKGDSTADRPHRISALQAVPDPVESLGLDQLRAVAAMAPTTESGAGGLGRVHGGGGLKTLDVEEFIRLHGLEVARTGAWNGGQKWVLSVCPWNPAHADRSAYIVRFPSGAIAAGCHHNGCMGNGWRELRRLFGEGPTPPDSTAVRGASRNGSGGAAVAEDADAAVEQELVRFISFVRSVGNAEKPRPMPIEVFPGAIRDLIVESEALPAVPDYMAVGVLAAAAAAIGRRVRVALTESYDEPAILNVAVIGDTGTMKTPVLKHAHHALKVLHREARRAFEADERVYKRDLAEWKRGGGQGAEPAKPQLRRFLTTDPTMEAIAMLAEHANGLLMYRDELVSWVLACDMYRTGGKGTDRQNWLSLWSGEPIIVDRKISGSLFVESPHVCVLGGIQPDVLTRLADEAGRQDGFLERILWCWPDPVEDHWTGASISRRVRDGVIEIIRALARRGDAATGGIEVGLSRPAYDLWTAWYELNAELGRRCRGHALRRGIYAKFRSQAPRLALILHCLEHPDGTLPSMIGVRTLTGALRLAEYFRSQAHRVIAHFETLGAARGSPVDRVWDALWNNGGDGVQQRHIHRLLSNNWKSATLLATLKQLEQAGRAECYRDSPGGRGRPAVYWRPLMGRDLDLEEATPATIDIDRLVEGVNAGVAGSGHGPMESF